MSTRPRGSDSESSAFVDRECSDATRRLEEIDPFDLMTDEILEVYLSCSYKWSFHHVPSFVADVKTRSLPRPLAWAVLAIAVRLV